MPQKLLNNHQSRRNPSKSPRELHQIFAFPARSITATHTRAFPRTPINNQKRWKQTKAEVEGKRGKEEKRLLLSSCPISTGATNRRPHPSPPTEPPMG
ncbi:hypothetical protein Taro_047887 [Colocasia esculenta]|uniref:Uncharacterized protein n=1 Tax=Colocasia esculenta TaxID=4460 RepID=A0A843X5X3_COLES|nr:hypothetical protein [Colocasia esculenta]